MNEEVKKKKLNVEIDPLEVIEPVVLQEITEESNGTVNIPEGYVVYCRQRPDAQSVLITTLRSGDKCNFDGKSKIGDYIWLHDIKGFWIRSDQVKCDGIETLKIL